MRFTYLLLSYYLDHLVNEQRTSCKYVLRILCLRTTHFRYY